jgi:uncharacterized Zn finger protein (UPF0148 family)
MVTVDSLLFPVLTLAVAIIIGALFNFVPVKSQSRKALPLVLFAAIAGAVCLAVAFLFTSTVSNALGSLSLFQTFTTIFVGVNIDIIKYNAPLVANIFLIAALEAGLGLGFGIVFAIGQRSAKSAVTHENDEPTVITPVKVASQTQPTTAANIALSKTPETDFDQGLRRDEQCIMELFLFGKVSKITPIVDASKPEGYFYEGIPQLDWDTKHSRQVLDTLVQKGYLNAEPVDKVIVCQTCGSGNLRLIKTCPECGSPLIRKETLIEHFSCGEVDTQSDFKTQNGDLICPNCQSQLQSIGSDYRQLPSAYKCLSCNAISSEPKIALKCGDCTSAEDVDDEPEILLNKYTANLRVPLRELPHIKPLYTCAQFFKALGYTIVAPAFISGRSGTQHLFDILILGRVGWMETQNTSPNKASPKIGNGNTAVEVLISSKPVDVEEITRILGKISDIECDFLLFAIPSLTPNARNFAQAYDLKVSEGKNIEEALANSKIPQLGAAKP